MMDDDSTGENASDASTNDSAQASSGIIGSSDNVFVLGGSGQMGNYETENVGLFECTHPRARSTYMLAHDGSLTILTVDVDV